MNEFPTPIQVFSDPVSLSILSLYVMLYVWERIFPRNENYPKIKYATIRGIVALVLFFLIGTYLPIITDTYLANYQVVDLSNLPVFGQILIGLLSYQLCLYFYHRALHNSNFLWRGFHQMHHSSERIDVPSTYFFSPMDMIGFTVLGSIVFALIMGLSPSAITPIIFILNFLSIFQHANIHTPHWLGYIIQRPEQHAVHHQRGVHKYNYSDFPVYDLIFGTFRNPKESRDKKAGLYDGASNQIWDMFLFKDLSKK